MKWPIFQIFYFIKAVSLNWKRQLSKYLRRIICGCSAKISGCSISLSVSFIDFKFEMRKCGITLLLDALKIGSVLLYLKCSFSILIVCACSRLFRVCTSFVIWASPWARHKSNGEDLFKVSNMQGRLYWLAVIVFNVNVYFRKNTPS